MSSPKYSKKSNGMQTEPARSFHTLRNTKIAIATSHALYYYRFATSLRALGVRFDSIVPASAAMYDGDIVLCTRKEAPTNLRVPVLYEDTSVKHPAVLCALMLQKIDRIPTNDTVIFGVDPGDRIGFSIFYGGREIGTSFHTSIDDLVGRMVDFMADIGVKKRIIRIGSGNMRLTKKISDRLRLQSCPSFELELVDEHGTTPKTHKLNRRGARDMHSARSIAQRSGRKPAELLHPVPS